MRRILVVRLGTETSRMVSRGALAAALIFCGCAVRCLVVSPGVNFRVPSSATTKNGFDRAMVRSSLPWERLRKTNECFEGWSHCLISQGPRFAMRSDRIPEA